MPRPIPINNGYNNLNRKATPVENPEPFHNEDLTNRNHHANNGQKHFHVSGWLIGLIILVILGFVAYRLVGPIINMSYDENIDKNVTANNYRENVIDNNSIPIRKTFPYIESLTLIGSGKDLRIIVTGHGFGSAPQKTPFTGNCNYFAFFNQTRNWSAGYMGGPYPSTFVTLHYYSWNDTEIVINGFGDHYDDINFVNMPGDTVGVDFHHYGSPGYSNSISTIYGVR